MNAITHPLVRGRFAPGFPSLPAALNLPPMDDVAPWDVYYPFAF